MSHCTGPYTRLPFARKDQKPLTKLLNALTATGIPMVVRAVPTTQASSDDFNLDIDLEDPANAQQVWDLRAAKFQGPKKIFGHANVFELAIRHRDADNTVIWEGYVFTDNLHTLAKRVPGDLQCLMAGDQIADLVPGADAQAKRIQLCTVG